MIGVQILAVMTANSDNFRIGRITTWLDPEGGTRMVPASRCFRDCMRSDPGVFRKRSWKQHAEAGMIPEARMI